VAKYPPQNQLKINMFIVHFLLALVIILALAWLVSTAEKFAFVMFYS
jgi:flagellar biogenesis protein FliO